MPLIRLVLVVAIASQLASCGTMRKQVEEENAYLVGADSIDPTLVSNEVLQKSTSNTRSYIGLIAFDSQKKCSSFVTSLVLAQNSINAGFDGATILLSALATAFTPLATVHALSAAATVSSGWKSAINADIYAKATIANYQQAILATYYKDLGEYVAILNNTDEAKLIASIEVVRIQAIHRECTLAAAQATISATLQSSAPQPTNETHKDTLTVGGTFSAPDNVSLTATSRALPDMLVNVFYPAKTTDTLKDVAAGLLEKVNNDPTLKAAGISAVQDNASNPNGKIILQSPAFASVVWSTNRPDKIKLNTGAPNAASGTPTTPAVTQPVVVPGRSLMGR